MTTFKFDDDESMIKFEPSNLAGSILTQMFREFYFKIDTDENGLGPATIVHPRRPTPSPVGQEKNILRERDNENPHRRADGVSLHDARTSFGASLLSSAALGTLQC